MFKHEIRKLI